MILLPGKNSVGHHRKEDSAVDLKTVKVPEEFKPIFHRAEQVVKGFFDAKDFDPNRGIISISGERYVLVRAMSLSVHFFEFMKEMYPGMTEEEAIEGSGTVLFNVAYSLGKSDARAFCTKLNVSDPVAKLSSGPVLFAHTGWAFVDIHPESHPVPDDTFYLLYDHPHSFEADSWIERGSGSGFCACFMNAGYSSGWCSESFGLELAAREIFCRARGDEYCRFIMAPPHKLEKKVSEYLVSHSRENSK
jgi:two-component system, cell cycle sensor histidine kinase and response regulator CckA